MTTALYRRYRPDAFQEVIGQDHVTAPLMAALRADRVTHAYLFSDPRGCGKTTLVTKATPGVPRGQCYDRISQSETATTARATAIRA